MSIKPVDLQTNILQLNVAAKEITKLKETSREQQLYAATLSEKEGKENPDKVEKVDKVEATIAPLENEIKDDRSKGHKNKKNAGKQKRESESAFYEDEKDNIFSDPSKGQIIDIRE